MRGFSARLPWFSGSLVWPGLGPAAEVLFFCFAKRKYPKKKRAEVRGPSGFLALLASWGKSANLSAARPSDMRISDPHAAALLSPATRQGAGSGAGYRSGEHVFAP